jgi:hypothetical protein
LPVPGYDVGSEFCRSAFNIAGASRSLLVEHLLRKRDTMLELMRAGAAERYPMPSREPA